MRGSSRRNDYEYPDTEWLYFVCAKQFGWTIEETDNQPAYMVDWLYAISGLVDEIENERIGQSK